MPIPKLLNDLLDYEAKYRSHPGDSYIWLKEDKVEEGRAVLVLLDVQPRVMRQLTYWFVPLDMLDHPCLGKPRIDAADLWVDGKGVAHYCIGQGARLHLDDLHRYFNTQELTYEAD